VSCWSGGGSAGRVLGTNRSAKRIGLKVYARLDTSAYPKGVEVTDAQLAAVNIHRHDFRGEWNYTIKPSVIEI
jgi:hypothetical protein